MDIHQKIIDNTLSKFGGVSVLYHYENSEVLLRNLGYLEELNELNEWQDKQNTLGSLKDRDRFSREWENVSWGNDLCDSFAFGEVPCAENGHEFSYTLFLPNSMHEDLDNEEYNQLYFVKKDMNEHVVMDMWFDNMEDFVTFWKVCRRSIVSDWKVI